MAQFDNLADPSNPLSPLNPMNPANPISPLNPSSRAGSHSLLSSPQVDERGDPYIKMEDNKTRVDPDSVGVDWFCVGVVVVALALVLGVVGFIFRESS